MSDASDTFRLGLDVADRAPGERNCTHSWHVDPADGLPACKGDDCSGVTVACGQGVITCPRHADRRAVPSYPGDGVGDGQPDVDVPMVVAPIAASLLVPTDEVTEVDTPDGPWYVVLEVHPDRIVVDGTGPDEEALPVDLPWRSTDRVLVRRIALPDALSDTASLAIDPALVTVAPSGRFGFYRPTNQQAWETEPVVQVAQVIARRAGMEFHPTPARYYARTIFGIAPGADLSIDHGQGWLLPATDVDALRRFAAAL